MQLLIRHIPLFGADLYAGLPLHERTDVTRYAARIADALRTSDFDKANALQSEFHEKYRKPVSWTAIHTAMYGPTSKRKP
jgi:hypothetical protein